MCGVVALSSTLNAGDGGNANAVVVGGAVCGRNYASICVRDNVVRRERESRDDLGRRYRHMGRVDGARGLLCGIRECRFRGTKDTIMRGAVTNKQCVCALFYRCVCVCVCIAWWARLIKPGYLDPLRLPPAPKKTHTHNTRRRQSSSCTVSPFCAARARHGSRAACTLNIWPTSIRRTQQYIVYQSVTRAHKEPEPPPPSPLPILYYIYIFVFMA